MSEEINDSNSSFINVPDFDSMINHKLNQNSSVGGTFDPHQMMIDRKDGVVNTTKVKSWPEGDIKMLEEFCKQHNIVGFNCGRMSPLAALSFLKSKLGIVDDGFNKQKYSPSNPYGKTLLKG